MTPAAGDGRVLLAEKEHRDLDVSRLHNDMLALWREEGAAAHGRGAVTRVCLSTLVVASGEGGDGDGDALLTDLVSLHPSRAIHIRSAPGRPPGSVESWVGGSCFRRPGGGSLVCSEVVHMVAGPDTDRRLASAARSLRVGGVPMFVVTPWTSPLDLPWLDRLGDVVDAVLADSARLSTGDARALWRRAAASGDTRYGDVQWESLGGWRRAIAFWFDRPGGSGTPSGIRTVIIAAADTGGGRHQGLLLAGWLGSRLGWEPVSGSGGELLRFTMRSGTSDVPVEIRPVPAAGDPSLLRSVTLGIAGAPGPVRWRRPAGEDALVVEAGEDRQFRLTRTQASPAATLLGFLRRSGPDPVAAAALRLAERLGGMAE